MPRLGWLGTVLLVFFIGAYVGTKYPSLNIGAKVLP